MTDNSPSSAIAVGSKQFYEPVNSKDLMTFVICRRLEGAQVASTSSYSSETQRFPELRFSATLRQEPEVELALV